MLIYNQKEVKDRFDRCEKFLRKKSPEYLFDNPGLSTEYALQRGKVRRYAQNIYT